MGYISIKKFDDYENVNSVNPLNLIIGKVDGFIEDNNGNKYLVFIYTDGNKAVLPKFIKLWDEIKYLIETTNGDKKVLWKLLFESDDNITLNKILKLHILAVVVRSVCEKDVKYYPQVFFWLIFVWSINARIW